MAVATKRDFVINYGLQTDNTGTSTGNTLIVDQVNDKVGIGIDPTEKLHVKGNVILGSGANLSPTNTSVGYIKFDGSGYDAYITLDTTALYFGHNSDGRDIRFQTATGSSQVDRLTIKGSGFVGINNTDPQSQLAVKGYITESTDNGTTYWNVVTQQDVGSDPNQVPLNQYLGKLAFLDDFSPNGLRREGGSSDDVIVNSTGYLAINDSFKDSSSDTPLYVGLTAIAQIGELVGSTNTGVVRLTDQGSTNNRYHGIEIRNRNFGDIRLLNHDRGYSNGADFVIAVDDDSPAGIVERLRIKGDTGNIGIGISDPGENLHVHGGSSETVIKVTATLTSNSLFGSGIDLVAPTVNNSPFIRFYDTPSGNINAATVDDCNWAIGADDTGISSFGIYYGGATGSNKITNIQSQTAYLKVTTDGDVVVHRQLHGPSNFIIDPAAVGDDTGTVEIKGNLIVQGTTTTINSTTVDLDHLSLGDNEIANFGDSNDLQIYHDGGSNRTIIDDSSGGLKIQSDGNISFTKGISENLAVFAVDGAVSLYYDNAQKFQTTSDGVRIGSSTAPIDINAYETLNNGTLSFEGSAGQLFSITNNLTSGSIFSVNDVSGIPSIDVDADGTISIAAFSGNVGIGITNPATKLHVIGTIRMSAVPGTNNNANQAVLHQTANGDIDGGSSLTFNPANDQLLVNGLSLTSNTIYGNGSLLSLTTQNGNGTIDLIITSTEIKSKSNFNPNADATYNLGSPSARWANIYSADLQLSNEGSHNDVDGTWGKYTIQEGENDLFLINRRSGKKYKFVLQEV